VQDTLPHVTLLGSINPSYAFRLTVLKKNLSDLDYRKSNLIFFKTVVTTVCFYDRRFLKPTSKRGIIFEAAG
jgi:hypothetical protein